MKTMIKFVTIVAIGLGLIMPLNMALADRESFNTLSAKWWQWATSIPTSKNPLLDTTGSNCMVGNTAYMVPGWRLWRRYNHTHMFRTCR
jgi:hypothetical protein